MESVCVRVLVTMASSQGAAAVVFFAYLGFDAIANFSEEVKNPNRDLPIDIIGSLVLCSVLYVAVSLVITGMVPYSLIDTDAPLSVAFEDIGWHWAAILVSIGAFSGLTTTNPSISLTDILVS